VLVLDFAGIEYISSVGLRILMIAAKQLRASDAKIAVAICSRSSRRSSRSAASIACLACFRRSAAPSSSFPRRRSKHSTRRGRRRA
jgi:hypothetical protein